MYFLFTKTKKNHTDELGMPPTWPFWEAQREAQRGAWHDLRLVGLLHFDVLLYDSNPFTHTRHFYPRFSFIDMCTYTPQHPHKGHTHPYTHTQPQTKTQSQTLAHAYIRWRSHTKEPSYERSLDYFCYK